jgi:hypothetical protein
LQSDSDRASAKVWPQQGKREGMAQGKRKEVERKLRYNPNPSPERRDG